MGKLSIETMFEANISFKLVISLYLCFRIGSVYYSVVKPSKIVEYNISSLKVKRKREASMREWERMRDGSEFLIEEMAMKLSRPQR